MDITSLSLTQILVLFSIVLGVSFVAVKYLIDHSFKQQEKLKSLEGVILTNMLEKFESDIDGLGSKLRGFKSAMESFQNIVAQVGINHERISLRIQQLENYNLGLESRIREIVQYEILKSKNDD